MNVFELVAAFMTAAATTITALRYRHERALQRRAFVQAKLVEYPEVSGLSRRGDPYRIELHNAGKAKAENLRLLLDGQDVKPLQVVGSMMITSRIPGELEPGAETLLRFYLFMGAEPPRRLTVLWDDLAGRDHSFDLDLPF
ncbi:hypothetical protein OO015_12320 [Thermomicrobium sp. 4228-Ro]|uniref:hypothetical protein n=1 Tax=Thermomicrobium sp. 4228-Ro TaxID=2993937 RepID=UPI00224934A0|nr:hypothetical protein [Thermomicrobium sp. 4228-Ro]MCX2728275.1 hypothetical protein [Thermomicrobium sp. 4228-Ro]